MEQELQKEQWIRWKPIENLVPRYYVNSISDDLKSLTLLLYDWPDEKKWLKITFEGPIYSYRATDEGLRLQIWNDLGEKYGDDFYANWTFFKVENSRYIAWLFDQSDGTPLPQNLTHFSILDTDSVLDIITSNEPKVEHL